MISPPYLYLTVVAECSIVPLAEFAVEGKVINAVDFQTIGKSLRDKYRILNM